MIDALKNLKGVGGGINVCQQSFDYKAPQLNLYP